MSETQELREKTWRERQEARTEVSRALTRLLAAEDAYIKARHAYWSAMQSENGAIQRDIEAWQ